jgi:hypothetical protein
MTAPIRSVAEILRERPEFPESDAAEAELWAQVARSPHVLRENALDRATGRDHRTLFTYLYGDAADIAQRLKDPRLTRSELDLDCAVLLAEYGTRDAGLIADVMAESALARPKWQENRTYLARTIATALRKAPDRTATPIIDAAVTEAPQPVTRSLADFLRDPDALKPPAAVIARTAWAGRVTLIASPEGWGKSTYVKAGCAAVTTGQAFLGEVGGPPGAVLWVRVEESEYDLMVTAHRFGADPARFVAWTPGAHPLAELVSEIRARSWAVVVVDSIHEFALRCGVTDLDDGAQVSPVLQPLVDASREIGTAMIWTGQANKATGSYRNSSTFGHMPDVVLEIVEPTEGSSQRKFRQKKSRFDSRGFTVEQVNNTYQLVVGDAGTTDLPRMSKERRRILDALKAAMGWAEWLAAYGGNRDTFSSGVRWLREHDFVRQEEERGTWSPNQFAVEQARAA